MSPRLDTMARKGDKRIPRPGNPKKNRKRRTRVGTLRKT
jgi:hypothetical protein